jgi:hypothetical protein
MKRTLAELINRGDEAYRHHNYFTCTKEEWQTLKARCTQPTAHNGDYAKCADDIVTLDLADAVINKRGVIIDILRRHFA